jgi:hypothetical protein
MIFQSRLSRLEVSWCWTRGVVAAGCGVLLLGRMKDYAKDFLGFIYKTYFQPSRLLPKLKIWRELIYYEFAAPWVRPSIPKSLSYLRCYCTHRNKSFIYGDVYDLQSQKCAI